MPAKRSILDELTIDELRASFDRYELDADDRRVRAQLVDALARSRRARIADVLYELSRDRLKQLCRAFGMDDTGRAKAELIERLTGSAGSEQRPPVTQVPDSPSLGEILLLENLLARLQADAAADRPQFRGIVSDAEREALRVVLGTVGRPAPPVDTVVERPEPVQLPEPVESTVGEVPPDEEAAETPPPAIGLNLDALHPDNAPPPEWVLCLDFGTAKSKAFAATNDEEDPELEPLALGDYDEDDASKYELSSCVWIDDDGRLFVGSEAVEQGMSYGGEPTTRRPLDSLKQEISQVDPEDGAAELVRRLPRDVDPTATLTYEDAITIYLAYLTDLATTAVARRVGTRYVRRRFTVPCWQSAQRRWAAALLGKSLLRAQVLADTFRNRWREGIPVERVASAVRAAAVHDGDLTRLAATESNDVTDDWNRGTFEALAAASACVWRDRFARDLMLVVDVGAGTTDLSLFWVVQDGDSHRAFPIADGNSGIRQAGDTLDRLLVEALLRKAGLGVDETGERARRGLRRKGVRQMKERLFQVGSLTETLVNDEKVTLSREEFIESDGVRKFADRIADEIQRLLEEGIHQSWERAAIEKGVTLVLTGGGCDLPMITALKDREWRLGGRAVAFQVARRVPRSVEGRFDAAFIQVYPRLAVAMGGVLSTRLDEKSALREWMGGTPAAGSLESFPTKGVWSAATVCLSGRGARNTADGVRLRRRASCGSEPGPPLAEYDERVSEVGLLGELLLLVGLSIPIVALAHRVGAPPLIGLIAAGLIVGPHGFGLIDGAEEVEALSELGVALLLFAIGLELSLSHVRRWARAVFLGGGLQVGATLGVVAAAALALGLPFGQAVFYGALVAMSSTAIVTRAYADRGDLDTRHGRSVISILLFQDLCILPLMLLLPLLARIDGPQLAAAAGELARGLAIMIALVAGGQFVVRWTLDRVVLFRDRDLFTLCVGFFGLAAALITSAAGFSIAIGAFIAGLIISESEYGLQALSDVLPFRALFSGIFFMSVGMLLDIPAVLAQLGPLLALTAGLMLLKALLVLGTVLALGGLWTTAVVSGLSLAQVGEFSFLLAAAGLPLGLFREGDYQFFLSAAVLSMVATPTMIQLARPFAQRVAARPGLARRRSGAPEAGNLVERAGHTIVVGYGLAGRYLARVLQAAGIACVVVEQNPELVARAREDGIAVVFGDGTRHAVLEHVRLRKARVIVFAISSATDERRGVALAREINPAVRIVVRTRYILAIDELRKLGANDVVVEEFEASLELFALALGSYEIPINRIWREVESVRNEHYALLRGKGGPDLRLDTLQHLGIHDALELVEVEEGAPAIGGSATTLELRRRTGAVQVAVVRDGQPIYRRSPDFRYRAGDTVVLVGDPDCLGRALPLFRADPISSSTDACRDGKINGSD